MAEAVEEKIAAPSAGIPIKLVIMIAAGMLIVGLGGAFAYFKFTGKGAETAEHPAAEAPAADKTPHDKKADASPAKSGHAGAPGAIFDLDPFIVNLADTPESRYLKITVKLELDHTDLSAELSSRMPQVRDTVLILLSSKDAASLRSTQGKFQLREELTQRVNSLLPKGGVRSAYFTEFVVQ